MTTHVADPTDECGTDCKSSQGADLKHITAAMHSALGARTMEQTCNECGHDEPAGGRCSHCGHFPPVATWYRRDPKRVTEAQMAGLAKARAAR